MLDYDPAKDAHDSYYAAIKAKRVEKILQETLTYWRKSPFIWGRQDCMMSVFSYVGQFTERVPGLEWYDTYSDENTARIVLDVAGGGCAGMDKALTAVGLPRVDIAHRGDPICAKIGDTEVGGIYLGPMTVFRMPGRGTIEMRVRHIGVWRL